MPAERLRAFRGGLSRRCRRAPHRRAGQRRPGLGARSGPGRARARAARRPRPDDPRAARRNVRPSARADFQLRSPRSKSEGFALAGSFTPGGSEREWCERRLLARIHRYTVKRLRAEIEPVSARDYLRFLFDWQGVSPDARREGGAGARCGGRAARGLRGAGGCMGGLDPAGAAFATMSRACSTMPALSGRIAWARLGAPAPQAEIERQALCPAEIDADQPVPAQGAAVWARPLCR